MNLLNSIKIISNAHKFHVSWTLTQTQKHNTATSTYPETRFCGPCIPCPCHHCYYPCINNLRQDDGGTKNAHFGSSTCFLRQFHDGSAKLFVEKSKNTLKLSNNAIFVWKITTFNKTMYKEILFIWKFPCLISCEKCWSINVIYLVN